MWVNQGDLCRKENGAGVRAPIVMKKPGNAGGAKGRRKVEAR